MKSDTQSFPHQEETRCKRDGEHKFFVATDVAVEEEGKVAVILCCTRCGAPLMHIFKVRDEVSKPKTEV